MHPPDRPMHLFVSDVDGTLLDANKALSPATIEAIGTVIAEGNHFVLCSSRMPKSLAALRRAISTRPEWMIAYNGALMINPQGQTIIDRHIDPRVAKAVFDLCARNDLHASIYSDDHWYSWGDDQWTEREIRHTAVTPDHLTVQEYVRLHGELPSAHKIMVMGDEYEIDALVHFLTNDADLHSLAATYRTKSTYVEIGPAGVSKATALAALGTHLGVSPDDMTYFGDNDNDVDALRFAGLGLAVANASPRALEAADAHLAAGVDDGVAAYLTSWLAEHPVTSEPR